MKPISKLLLFVFLAAAALPPKSLQATQRHDAAVSAAGIRGKVMCGYQGWFRCPGDAAALGWIHWSRDPKQITPETLTFEMWPDVSELSPRERYPAPGFTMSDGHPAELFSSDNARTVLRHFEWMRDYDIDGVWLQHFVVDLPDQPNANRYATRMSVLQHVRTAASKTGRVWALSYDIAGAKTETIYQSLTADWKRMVDTGITRDQRYLHEGKLPVAQIWGFYYKNNSNLMTAELANRLIDFFRAPGKYHAYLVGGGDWDWRRNPDPDWQKIYARFDAYVPWNIGNFSMDAAGVKSASTGMWEEDRRLCEQRHVLWIPSLYPGFAWDNLQRLPAGKSVIPRRRGEFLREQFVKLAHMHGDTAYIAMFDEVDEGTAIFKVAVPPTQGHFQDFEGLPSDAYLKIVGEGNRMLENAMP